MKTEINIDRIFVLTDDENRVVAVIEAPLNIEDFKAKICSAITDDTNYENVVITNEFIFDEDTFNLEFEAEYEEDGEEEVRTWYLDKTGLY
jgi:hypothetical protein